MSKPINDINNISPLLSHDISSAASNLSTATISDYHNYGSKTTGPRNTSCSFHRPTVGYTRTTSDRPCRYSWYVNLISTIFTNLPCLSTFLIHPIHLNYLTKLLSKKKKTYHNDTGLYTSFFRIWEDDVCQSITIRWVGTCLTR